MFLSEMVRHVGDEENLVNSSGYYTRSGTSWGTIHDYGTITPATPGIYLLRYQNYATDNRSGLRVKVGARYIHGHITPTYGTYYQQQAVVSLPAGSQVVIVEHRHSSSAGSGRVNDFKLGRVVFSDVDAEALQTYASALTVNVPSRPLPIGSMKQLCLIVNCWAYTPADYTNFENVGDSLTNGVSLSVEGSQVNWTDRNQNDMTPYETAWACYFGAVAVGEDSTVAITKDNANTVVHISVIACPWILPGDTTFEPVDLSFPQGSTLYVMLEPLQDNPTKYVKIGKVRAITYGDATDFYSTASGTNILTHNYTFQEVKNGAVVLYLYGRGGCVSSIGVDVR